MARRPNNFDIPRAMRIARRIAQFREEAGLTQLDLATRAGIREDRLRAYEDHRNLIDDEAAEVIAKELGRTLDDLANVGAPSTPTPPARPKLFLRTSIPPHASPEARERVLQLQAEMQKVIEERMDEIMEAIKKPPPPRKRR